jgi:hypothetical protein
VVMVVILSSPRHSVADPRITPSYTRRRTVPVAMARRGRQVAALSLQVTVC